MRVRRLGLGVVVVVAVVACRRRDPAAGADGASPLVTPSKATVGDPASLPVVSGPPGLAAFPGAEGFGASATGGRGGRVLYVTTLAPRGPGSLQEALDAEGPRTILFRVSGRIEGVPILSRGDVTIAGQSSPGGITLRGLLVQGDVVCEGPSAPECPTPKLAPKNFVVRHLRIRPGHFDDPNGAGDGLRLHHAKLGVVDHVSIGNAADEAVQVSFSSDVTIQRSIFAETLGEHAELGGMLVNYSDPARGAPLTRLTVHHNVWNRIFGRLPEVSRENVPDASTMDLEVSANLYWDPRRPAYVAASNPQDGKKLAYRLNWVGNASVQDPAQPRCFGLFGVEGGPDPSRPSFFPGTSVYVAKNSVSRSSRTDLELVYGSDDFCAEDKADALPLANAGPKRPAWAAASRHPFPAVTYPADEKALARELYATAGAFPRDPLDRRVMRHVADGTFDKAPIDKNPARDTDGLPFASPPAPPLDTDGDGMPDTWEAANGLDPKSPADGALTTLSPKRLGVAGYTNLEVYLEERSREVMRGI